MIQDQFTNPQLVQIALRWITVRSSASEFETVRAKEAVAF